MRRFRLFLSLAGFVMLAAVLVAPARGQQKAGFRHGNQQFGMSKAMQGGQNGFGMASQTGQGGCQKSKGGGPAFGMQTPFGQGGGGSGVGMQTPFGQGGDVGRYDRGRRVPCRNAGCGLDGRIHQDR